MSVRSLRHPSRCAASNSCARSMSLRAAPAQAATPSSHTDLEPGTAAAARNSVLRQRPWSPDAASHATRRRQVSGSWARAGSPQARVSTARARGEVRPAAQTAAARACSLGCLASTASSSTRRCCCEHRPLAWTASSADATAAEVGQWVSAAWHVASAPRGLPLGASRSMRIASTNSASTPACAGSPLPATEAAHWRSACDAAAGHAVRLRNAAAAHATSTPVATCRHAGCAATEHRAAW